MRAWARRSVVTLSTFGALALALACGGPKYPNCENDEHCNSDGHTGVCVNGTCVECRDDAGCGHGKECQAGRCAAVEGFCDEKSPCPGGAPCTNNRCQPKLTKAEPRECGEAMPPCPNGQRCENGHCVAPPQGGPGCTSFEPPKFDFEGAEIRPDARATLKRLADCINTGSLKNANVLLTGHCDPRGENEFNMSLGAQRAETVKTFLTGLGLPANKISTSSRGELDARGTDEAGWQDDRRVDIEVR